MSPADLYQMEENIESEDLLCHFGMEVEKMIKDSQLTTVWVRKESHFCNSTFNDLKKGNLHRLNFVKVVHLTRTLFKGNPSFFHRWYRNYFWYLISGSTEPL